MSRCSAEELHLQLLILNLHRVRLDDHERGYNKTRQPFDASWSKLGDGVFYAQDRTRSGSPRRPDAAHVGSRLPQCRRHAALPTAQRRAKQHVSPEMHHRIDLNCRDEHCGLCPSVYLLRARAPLGRSNIFACGRLRGQQSAYLCCGAWHTRNRSEGGVKSYKAIRDKEDMGILQLCDMKCCRKLRPAVESAGFNVVWLYDHRTSMNSAPACPALHVPQSLKATYQRNLGRLCLFLCAAPLAGLQYGATFRHSQHLKSFSTLPVLLSRHTRRALRKRCTLGTARCMTRGPRTRAHQKMPAEKGPPEMNTAGAPWRREVD